MFYKYRNPTTSWWPWAPQRTRVAPPQFVEYFQLFDSNHQLRETKESLYAILQNVERPHETGDAIEKIEKDLDSRKRELLRGVKELETVTKLLHSVTAARDLEIAGSVRDDFLFRGIQIIDEALREGGYRTRPRSEPIQLRSYLENAAKNASLSNRGGLRAGACGDANVVAHMQPPHLDSAVRHLSLNATQAIRQSPRWSRGSMLFGVKMIREWGAPFAEISLADNGCGFPERHFIELADSRSEIFHANSGMRTLAAIAATYDGHVLVESSEEGATVRMRIGERYCRR
jgi:hypothetical protein